MSMLILLKSPKLIAKTLFSLFVFFMRLRASFTKKVFKFNFSAKTSRGPMEDKVSWFIKLWDELNPEVYGIGECGPLPGLSLDARSDFEEVLGKILLEIEDVKYREGEQQFLPANDGVFNEIISSDFPAIRFGVETAWLDLQHGGQRIIFKNDFLLGEPIQINGLIWMGGLDEMRE